MEEIWKDIVGYEGWYQVSNLGRVKRIKSGYGARVGRILKSGNGDNYPVAWLHKGGKPKGAYVHTLVLEAFVSSRPPGCECNHKNGIKSDNRSENLEWVTRSENRKHAHRTLRRKFGFGRGENHCNAKLTEEKVLKIRNLFEMGEYTKYELGEMFGCSYMTIHDAVCRHTWIHI